MHTYILHKYIHTFKENVTIPSTETAAAPKKVGK